VLGCAECTDNALAGVDALTDGEAAECDAADGDAPDGDATAADVADGDATAGDVADGNVAEGDAATTGARSSTRAVLGARLPSPSSESRGPPGSSTHSPTLATILYPNRGTFAMYVGRLGSSPRTRRSEATA